MEDGNVDTLLQLALDVEAFGRLDIFQVDAADGGGNHLAKQNDLVDALGVDFNVKHVDVGKALKEDSLAFHNRFRGQRAAVAQAENGSTIADDGHQVALGGVVISKLGIIGDREHGVGNTR